MGLDRSIPYYAVNMVCSAPDCAPRDAALPAGYTFAGYQDGMEDAWVSILLGTDMAGSREGALECFQEFRENLPLTRERMRFVRDASGEPIATAIAKAMLSRLFRRYDELGLKGRVFLVTQSWSYPAIRIYQKYGFAPAPSDPPEAWQCIFSMLEKN